MSIKSLLLFLFLYVCLVWVGAALLKDGPEIRTFGLFWTAAGLIAVLAWIVFSWAWGWFRVTKARSAAKPRPASSAPPVIAMHEDDAALLALIQEAKTSLARSATAAQYVRFSDLPLYLIVGPEGVGKTSSFLNSGIEPVCLSGQPAGAGQTIPTRLCNVWLARNALFIELGGRAFSGDLGRWASLLRTLRGGSTLPWWQRFYKESDSGLSPRGILALGDVKEFMGASSPQGRDKLERLSSLWRERLGAITEVFGRQFPVYWITTKTDLVPYFADYFGRLRGTELSQIFGCTLALAPPNAGTPELASAQAENKRLTKSTSPLLHRLAERRVIHLAREDDPRRKPGIYEFPREMRRIRPTIVQFMVDVFRPHPLRHTPFLRGYYFTATCEEETGFVVSPTRASLPDDSSVISDATAVFKADATQVFQSTDPKGIGKPAARTGVARRWAFITELLTSVILPDNVVPRTVPVQIDQRLDLYRKVACGAVCFVSLVLCLCFIRSWSGNSQLLESLNGGSVSTTSNPTVDDLKALDKLHDQALLLSNYDRKGAPWKLRWGLYTGGSLVQPARDLYFHRFGQMLLFGLNDSITSKLKSIPDVANADDPNYRPVSELLKTHLMISSGVCNPEPAFVSRVLKRTLDESNPTGGHEWRELAGRQIDFYSDELPKGNPVRVSQDTPAVEHAREYLKSIQGPDRLYAALLNGAEKRLTNPQTLSSLAPNYDKVLTGPGAVSGAFTPEGWAYIKNASKDVKANMPGDSCLDDSKGIATYQQDAALESAIQRSFVRDYIARWQKFVGGFAVIRYAGPSDAARKLKMLSDPKSPLLALFALASKNTYFPPAQPSAIEKSIAPITSVFDKAKETITGAKKDLPLADGKQIESTADIVKTFQPVQQVVPPLSDTWVTEKNKAYLDALADLGQSMDAIAHNTNSDPAVLQAASQNYDKALNASRQLKEALAVNSNGLDTTVDRLLDEPITQCQVLIPKPIDAARKINGAAQRFCASIEGTLRKFPFQPSNQDAGLDEFSRLFAPGSGAVWKFQTDNLADSVVKEAALWKAKDGAKVPPSNEMLIFLNRAQALTDAFFPVGTNQPQFHYTLRPKLDAAFQNVFIELDVDGQPFQWKNSIQHQFTWPATGGSVAGAVGRVVTADGLSFSFSSYGGPWAIFRVMGEAEPRLLGSKIVEWKYSRGREGRAELIKPAPVRLEFVDLPGGQDVFNPKFFGGLQCAGRAVQQLQQ